MKIFISVLLLLAFLFASDTSSFADSVTLKAIVPKTPNYSVPRTGKTTSEVDYDDGDYQKGAPPVPDAQYTDNGDNTVTDNGTGLMWIKDPTVIDVFRNCFWWSVAINCITTNLNTTGYPPGKLYKDWRMPNIKELESIANLYYNSPVIDPIFITNMQTGPGGYYYYWSSTRRYGNNDVYVLVFKNGAVQLLGKNDNTDYIYVRPVRGGVGGAR